MSLLDDAAFPHHDVTVETFTGRGPRGDQYNAVVTRSVIVDDDRKMVRDSNGDQVVSSTTIYDRLDQYDLYTGGSRVTVNGDPTRVIGVARRELDPDVSHLEITLA